LFLQNDAETQGSAGIKILKAKGHELKLQIDTTQCSLEPVLVAVMRNEHIIDMTIADPPMEEIIAMMYRQAESEGAEKSLIVGEHQLDALF
jgi:ABC-type uncharacterized transport system ATPase subunit